MWVHIVFQCGPVVKKLQWIIITAKICVSALQCNDKHIPLWPWKEKWENISVGTVKSDWRINGVLMQRLHILERYNRLVSNSANCHSQWVGFTHLVCVTKAGGEAYERKDYLFVWSMHELGSASSQNIIH